MAALVKYFQKVLGHPVDVFGQTRFVPRCRVPMDHAFVDRFVDESDRGPEKFPARVLVMAGDGGPKILDRRPQFAAVAAVDLVPTDVLPGTFFR
jgi:hypothetical protein